MAHRRIYALEYHDVVLDADPDSSGFGGPAAASYKLSPEVFQAHLGALASTNPMVGRGVLDALAREIGAPEVVLTFDDGGTSARALIADSLEARAWHAHVFIATDFIGKPGFASAADLRELSGRGHIIGSHSKSHPMRMAACSREQLRSEWRDSVDELSNILEMPVLTGAVPGGYYTLAVAEAAAEAGIKALFTSEPVSGVTWVGDCAVIGRYTLRHGHSPAYAASLVGPWPFSRAGQWASWNARKVAKVALGRFYLRIRSRMLGERNARIA